MLRPKHGPGTGGECTGIQCRVEGEWRPRDRRIMPRTSVRSGALWERRLRGPPQLEGPDPLALLIRRQPLLHTEHEVVEGIQGLMAAFCGLVDPRRPPPQPRDLVRIHRDPTDRP